MIENTYVWYYLQSHITTVGLETVPRIRAADFTDRDNELENKYCRNYKQFCNLLKVSDLLTSGVTVW